MTLQTEKEAKERRKCSVELSKKIFQGSIKAGSAQFLFRRQNILYVHHIEVLVIFKSMGFPKLYGVSRAFSRASKESQDLSNAPRALIATLTNLTSV